MSAISKNPSVKTVSIDGVLKCGGPGCYVFEGRSNSGKNYLLEHQVRHARRQGLAFSNIISFSGSQEENDSLNFIETLYSPEAWTIALSLDEVLYCISKRKEHVGELKAKLGALAAKKFKKDNPLLVILDDIGGLASLTQTQNNPWFQVVTTMRNLGIYMVFLIQYPKQIGPGFWNNCRALCSFDRSDSGLKYYCSTSGMSMDIALRKEVLEWLREKHRFLMWWNDWILEGQKLPSLPWAVNALKEGCIPLIEPLEGEPCSDDEIQ